MLRLIPKRKEKKLILHGNGRKSGGGMDLIHTNRINDEMLETLEKEKRRDIQSLSI